jgi:hypothetical protein
MEPNKLENQFREKLLNREINPSVNTWDRLDAMLSVTDTNDSGKVNIKPKSNFLWLYIAASIVGFLLIGTIFINQKENNSKFSPNQINVVTETPKNNATKSIKPTEIELIPEKPILKQINKSLVQSQKKINSIHPANSTTPLSSLQAFSNETKPIEAVQEIAATKTTTPNNIDELLASVEKNSKSNKKKSSLKINSATLLNQVDGELQITFREKAFNTIAQKYKEAKEALANRNNQ